MCLCTLWVRLPWSPACLAHEVCIFISAAVITLEWPISRGDMHSRQGQIWLVTTHPVICATILVAQITPKTRILLFGCEKMDFHLSLGMTCHDRHKRILKCRQSRLGSYLKREMYSHCFTPYIGLLLKYVVLYHDSSYYNVI